MFSLMYLKRGRCKFVYKGYSFGQREIEVIEDLGMKLSELTNKLLNDE